MIGIAMRVPLMLLALILSGAATGSGSAAYMVDSLDRLASAALTLPAIPLPPVTALPPAAAVRADDDVALHVRDSARVFAEQLATRVGGTLLAMSERDGQIEATWSSPACDASESEILDLIDAIHHQFPHDVRRIAGLRECAGTRRRYDLSGRSFALYHSGEMGSRDVLRYLIEVSSTR
jgi:hypothetical protein